MCLTAFIKGDMARLYDAFARFAFCSSLPVHYVAAGEAGNLAILVEHEGHALWCTRNLLQHATKTCSLNSVMLCLYYSSVAARPLLYSEARQSPQASFT